MPWEITGNFGTNAAQHFLGTVDDQAFSIRVNSRQALRIEAATTPNLIGGHESNQVTPGVTGATISGGGAVGSPNRIEAAFGVIAGGVGNQVRGERATVAGGEGNSAGGAFSLAAGRRAQANHAGTFVWSDADDAEFGSTADNQFLIQAAGGVGIGTPNPQETLDVSGRIKAGPLTLGAWPANASYAFVGANSLDQSQAGNYALRQGDRQEIGETFLNSPVAIHFRIADHERLTLDKNGQLGVGVFAPQGALHVNGMTLTTTLAVQQSIVRDDGRTDLIMYRDPDVGDWSLLRTNKGHGLALIGKPDQVALSVSRLTGFVGIGNVTPSYQLSLGKDLARTKVALYDDGPDNAYGIGVVPGHFILHVNGPKAQFAFCDSEQSNANEVFTISGTGDVRHRGKIGPMSSRALKAAITDLSLPSAQELLAGLRAVTYYAKDDLAAAALPGAEEAPLLLGFIADEVPEVVASRDRESIYPNHIIAVLVRVVQEQQGILAELQRRPS